MTKSGPGSTERPRNVPAQPSHYPQPPQPEPAGFREKLSELHRFLDDAASTVRATHDNMLGARPEPANSCDKIEHTPSIQELLYSATTKAACLAGDVQTINQSL